MGKSSAIIPQNLVKGGFVHFPTDNVDINEMDRKGTSHATKVVAWQCGPAEGDLLGGIYFSMTVTPHIPDAVTDITTVPNSRVTERPLSGLIAK